VLQLLSYTDYKYALKSSAGAPKYWKQTYTKDWTFRGYDISRGLQV
jgi:hypothetical protein